MASPEQLEKAQFSFQYSLILAPFFRELLSRTPKSAFKMPETNNAMELTFTNPLDDFLNEQKNLIPFINIPWQIRICVDRLFELGLGSTAKGIFRVPGSAAVINALFEKIDHAELPDLVDASCGVEEVSGLLKKLIRDRFKENVFQEELIESVTSASKQEDIPALKAVVFRMHHYNFAFLKEIFYLLRLVADKHEENMMNVNNLATIFGGMLQFLCKEMAEDIRTLLCKLLIEHYHEIFGDHSSLQHSVMSQKNVPVYLDDGSKKQILITANDTADTLRAKIIVKGKTSGTLSEDSLNRSVLCEIGDREIRDLEGNVLIGKMKAFLFTDKYHTGKIKEIMAKGPSLVINEEEEKKERRKSDSSSDRSVEEKLPSVSTPLHLKHSKSKNKQSHQKLKPSRSSMGRSDGSSMDSPGRSDERDRNYDDSLEGNRQKDTEFCDISRWFNSIPEISEIYNTKFTEILKSQGYITTGHLFQFKPTAQQMTKFGIPIYFSNLIHAKIDEEIQSKKIKQYQNSISMWLESMSIPATFMGKFSESGYTSLSGILTFPPTELQLVEMGIPLLYVNQILRGTI